MTFDPFDFSQEASLRRIQLQIYWSIPPRHVYRPQFVSSDGVSAEQALKELKESHPNEYQLLTEYILPEDPDHEQRMRELREDD